MKLYAVSQSNNECTWVESYWQNSKNAIEAAQEIVTKKQKFIDLIMSDNLPKRDRWNNFNTDQATEAQSNILKAWKGGYKDSDSICVEIIYTKD